MDYLRHWIESLKQKGYSTQNAAARVCQDIILKAIADGNLSKYVTIKGGVVMRSITGSIRRATQDMDLDFIRYSLEDDSIRRFVSCLNCPEGIILRISAPIEKLSQQEYCGKRVHITISDNSGYTIRSKIDFGVHKQLSIEQDEYCFDICMDDDGACLFINSKEQIFAEKIRSLLRFGPLSTRYKDIFDLCYLSGHLNRDRLIQCLDTYILSDPEMRENSIQDIRHRIHLTFRSRTYRQRLEQAGNANWLNMNVSDVCDRLEAYLEKIK